MYKKENIYGVIVAAGSGHRFGAEIPKQFCLLGGRPLLMTTIERMSLAIDSKHILVVIDRGMEALWNDLCFKHDFISPKIVYGGTTRQQSVENALQALADAGADVDATVMIHDGARPLATVGLFKTMSMIPGDSDGLIPVIPITDSLREIEKGGSSAVDRARFVAVQTPQVFRLGILLKAYASAKVVALTDDSSVVEFAGFRNIRLSPGEQTNMKVTNPADMILAEAILMEQLGRIDKKNSVLK